MKKALNISLAGTLFAIEEDAYHKLDAYLSSVKSKLEGTEGRDEIVRDIESRVAEHFAEDGKPVVDIASVEAIIASMGTAEDIGGAGKEDALEGGRRKLYRSSDDAIIGGVCAGLGTYFQVDPIWFRIGFVLLTLSSGFGLVLYILLWLIIPEAKSAADKLQMSGSPVTIETLASSVREKVENANAKHGSKIRKILSAPFRALRAVLRGLGPVVRTIVGAILALGSLAAVGVASFFAPLAIIHGPSRAFEFPMTDIIPLWLFYATIVAAYLAIAIPAICVFISAIGIFRRKTLIKAGVGIGLLGAWCLSIVFAGVSVATASIRYHDYAKTNPTIAPIEKEISINAPFTGLSVGSGLRIDLLQASTTRLVASGRGDDIDKLEVKVENRTLSIGRPSPIERFCIFCFREPIRLQLAAPSLSAIALSGGARLEAEDWKASEPLSLTASSGASGDIFLQARTLSAESSSGAFLRLVGSSISAAYVAKSGAHVSAEDLTAETTTAESSSGGSIDLSAEKSLRASAESGGSVGYKGDPVIQKTERSGGNVFPIDR